MVVPSSLHPRLLTLSGFLERKASWSWIREVLERRNSSYRGDGGGGGFNFRGMLYSSSTAASLCKANLDFSKLGPGNKESPEYPN
jgi:hypothetical protein